MSYDVSRNATELGEGIPLYTVTGDIGPSFEQTQVSTTGPTTIAPTATISYPFGLKPATAWLIAIVILIVLGFMLEKQHGLPRFGK